MTFISNWTDDRIDRLRADYAEGYSCAQIAARLGDDVTRNAVIGKVHRLGLAKPLNVKAKKGVKASREPKQNKGRHRAVTRIVRSNGNSNQMRVISVSETEQYKLRCVEIVPRNLSLMDLEPNDCRYPYGDGPFLFCGHPKRIGSQFCAPHHALCWVKPIVQKPKSRIYRGTDFARGAA